MSEPSLLKLEHLPDWVTRDYLLQLFAHTRAVQDVHMSSQWSAGGGKLAYMRMVSPQAAAQVLQTYNGKSPPNAPLRLEMSWATEASFSTSPAGQDGAPLPESLWLYIVP